MKKYFVVLFLFFITVSAFARDVEETFLQANRCYQNKELHKALDLYSSIGRKGSATWYNMGNCAFKLNKYVDALIYWRRAQRNATAQELGDIRKNIGAVNQVLGIAVEQSSFWNFIDAMLSRFSLFAFQLFFLFVWFVLFVGVWFFKKKKSILLGIFLPVNLFFGAATFLKYRAQSYPSAIIKESSASLFAGPDQNYHVVGNLSLAQEVRVIELRQEWCKIKASRLAGWVLADKLEVV